MKSKEFFFNLNLNLKFSKLLEEYKKLNRVGKIFANAARTFRNR